LYYKLKVALSAFLKKGQYPIMICVAPGRTDTGQAFHGAGMPGDDDITSFVAFYKGLDTFESVI
jgi:hypothetical protein